MSKAPRPFSWVEPFRYSFRRNRREFARVVPTLIKYRVLLLTIWVVVAAPIAYRIANGALQPASLGHRIGYTVMTTLMPLSFGLFLLIPRGWEVNQNGIKGISGPLITWLEISSIRTRRVGGITVIRIDQTRMGRRYKRYIGVSTKRSAAVSRELDAWLQTHEPDDSIANS